eukprot:6407418-Amphidinium_carterae.3
MVQPDSSSMGKVREAIDATQRDLNTAYATATAAMEKYRAASPGQAAAELRTFTAAAAAYASLYRGQDLLKQLYAACKQKSRQCCLRAVHRLLT